MNWISRQERAPNTSGVSEPPILMPAGIWQILSGRGICSAEEIEFLLQPKLKDLAHPFSLHDMDKAIKRLIQCLEKNESILIYGDYDLDGTPGLALLKHGLSALNFKNIKTYQPSRSKDGYGLHGSVIQNFANEGGSLVLTVDVGITDIDSVHLANSLGVDVIITDHHLPKEHLPEALAIVNPNKGSCTSKLQHLCGTGVAFYLILALRMELIRKGQNCDQLNPKSLLDLFALATITDMVPLVKENRVLVKHGLKVLEKTERPGLKRLFQELGFYGRPLTAQDVAFRIAPKLNALTRIDGDLRAFDVISAEEANADILVKETLLVNQQRVKLQEKAKSLVKDLIDDSPNKSFVFICSHEFHPGVVSLIASDLVGQFNVPAFVGSVHKDGRVVGSARAPGSHYHLQEILKSAESVLEKFGGHQMAAGFEFSKEKECELRNLLANYFEESKSDGAEEMSEESIVYDASVKIKEMNAQFMSWYENLGPYGVGFEAPLIRLSPMKVLGVKKLKGNFYKYQLSDGFSQIDAPWFNKAKEFPAGSTLEVLGEPQWNEFQGRRSIQFHIKHAREL